MDYKKRKLLCEGTSKKVYTTSEPDYNILLLKDVRNKKTIPNRGKHCAAVSTSIFKLLKSYHIPNHFIQQNKPNELVVKNLDMIPVQITVWNYVSKEFYNRFDVFGEGEALPCPVIEMYMKSDKKQKQMVNLDHVCVFGYATPEDIQHIDTMIRKINAILKSHFERRNLKLVKLVLEFGWFHNKLLLGDEISPDTCGFWDIDGETGKIDQKRFHPDQMKSEVEYEELRNRISPA